MHTRVQLVTEDSMHQLSEGLRFIKAWPTIMSETWQGIRTGDACDLLPCHNVMLCTATILSQICTCEYSHACIACLICMLLACTKAPEKGITSALRPGSSSHLIDR
jgi:hypothetical protein